MKFKSNHGIYMGYINNPGAKNDHDVNSFLKDKTIGSVSRVTNVATDHHVVRPLEEREYVQCVFHDLQHALRWGVKSMPDVQWLLLFAAGTIIPNRKPYELWLDQLPLADNTSIAAFTHILMPDDRSYFHINQQVIAINMHALRLNKDLVWPLIDIKGEKPMDVAVEKSPGDYHDRYTPHWVIHNKSQTSTMMVNKDSAWLAALINRGYSVMNFSDETMRQAKLFFYLDTPEQVELGRAYMRGEPDEQLEAMAQKIGKKDVMRAFLRNDRFQHTSCLLSNTMEYYHYGLPEKGYAAAVIPAAGWNFIRLFEVLKGDISAMYHFDIAAPAVDFRRDMIEKWDGENFADFAETVKQPGAVYYGTPSRGGAGPIWPRVRGIQHKYEVADLFHDWQRLLERVRDDGHRSVLIDITNILSYHESVYKFGFDRPTQLFKQLVDFLRAGFDDWCVKSDFFCLCKDDYELWERQEFMTTARHRMAYGYFVHKVKSPVPIGPFSLAWENSTPVFDSLFKTPAMQFEIRAREAAMKVQGPTSWASFYKQNYLPAVKLDLQFDSAKMLEEAKRAYEAGLFTTHRRDEEHGWSSFVIHGMGFGKTQSYESYNPGKTAPEGSYKFIAEARQHCPTIVDYFENIFPRQSGVSRFSRVRIMALEPGGFIVPHYDSFDSTCPGPINMALNNPRNCHFHMWKGSNFRREEGYHGILPFTPGTALNIDVGNSHMVYNLSDEVRFHMIAHVELDESNRAAYGEFRNRSLNLFLDECREFNGDVAGFPSSFEAMTFGGVQ